MRSSAIELVEQLSSDELIADIVGDLKKFAERLANGDAKEAEYKALPRVAMGLGVLAMIKGNVARIATHGGVAPSVAVFAALAKLKTCLDHEELLATLCGALLEVRVDPPPDRYAPPANFRESLWSTDFTRLRRRWSTTVKLLVGATDDAARAAMPLKEMAEAASMVLKVA